MPTSLVVLSALGMTSPSLADDAAGYDYLIAGEDTKRPTATDISSDGTTVVGYSYDSSENSIAERWTRSGEVIGFSDPFSLSNMRVEGTNIDGSVVVGYGSIGPMDTMNAFRWSENDGMIDLGISSDKFSYARATNDDGTVVVGSYYENHGHTAFRWTEADGVEDLGSLDPDLQGSHSEATDVSSDGRTVVGYSNGSAGGEAFRWTRSDGMVGIGKLEAGLSTYAQAVSRDGKVIVGHGSTADGWRAFRWTGETGIESLGTLHGGDYSLARDTDGDGDVVVGFATLDGKGHGFRWTESTGMITVEDWLRAEGVTIDEQLAFDATAVSAAGDVIVGPGPSGPYIARGSQPEPEPPTEPEPTVPEPEPAPTEPEPVVPEDTPVVDSPVVPAPGIILIADYTQTLAARPGVEISLGHADTVLNGAHGYPMRNLLEAGQRSFGFVSDLGYDDGPISDGSLGVFDLSLAQGLGGGATARIAVGGFTTDQDIDTGGDFTHDGFYVAPDLSFPLMGTEVYATVGAYYAEGEIDIVRGYRNGSALDVSRGSTDTRAWGGKVRLDWRDALVAGASSFTPYGSVTHLESRMDGYTETGGSFPARFDEVEDEITIARLGIDLVHEISDEARLLARTEAAHRFQDEGAAFSGRILGISDFALTGEAPNQTWLRGGLGGEFEVGRGTASLTANVTTEGNDPTTWLRASYTIEF